MARRMVLGLLALGLVIAGTSCADRGAPSRDELVNRFRRSDAAGHSLSKAEAECWADATFGVLSAAEIDAIARGSDYRLPPARQAVWGDALKSCVLRSAPGSVQTTGPVTPAPSSPSTRGANP